MEKITTENGYTLAAKGPDGSISIILQATRSTLEYSVPVDPADELGCEACQ